MLVVRQLHWPALGVPTGLVLSCSHYQYLLCTFAAFPFKRWALPTSHLSVFHHSSPGAGLCPPLSPLSSNLQCEPFCIAGLSPTIFKIIVEWRRRHSLLFFYHTGKGFLLCGDHSIQETIREVDIRSSRDIKSTRALL